MRKSMKDLWEGYTRPTISKKIIKKIHWDSPGLPVTYKTWNEKWAYSDIFKAHKRSNNKALGPSPLDEDYYICVDLISKTV